jgi:hypothetical protein
MLEGAVYLATAKQKLTSKQTKKLHLLDNYISPPY